MGSSQSATTPPLAPPAPLVTTQKTKQPRWGSRWKSDSGTTLSEDRAWAIATAWRDQLLGCDQWHQRVRLKTDSTESDDDLAIVQRYEWVKIKLSSDDEAAIARAAATAWFWLSCCAGYSGRENPQFWKRVFSELQRHTDGPRIADCRPPRTDASITDAIRFFDRPGREFPRFRIKTAMETSVVQVFLGTRAAPTEPMRDHKLQSIYVCVRPFLVAKRLDRAPDVAIQSCDRPAIEPAKPTVEINSAMTAEAMAVAEQLNVCPRFQVHSWLLHRCSLEPETQTNAAWLSDRCVQVKRIVYTAESESYSQDVAAAQLRTLFLVDDPNGGAGQSHSQVRDDARVRSLQLYREKLPAALLASVCSVLPHAQRISTLHITTPEPHGGFPFHGRDGTPYREFKPIDWAWIGYAIFHPDAPASTWSSLDFGVDDFTEDAVQVLQLMATGNNLHRFIPDSQPTDPPSTFYYTARLREVTELRDSASPTSVAAAVIGTLPQQSHVCLLGTDVASTDGLVRVVAPGYGIGWIHSSALCDIVARPPSTSSLQGLRLHIGEPYALSPEAIGLVKTIGASVVRLDATVCGELDTATLSDVLVSCPVLQTLSVEHDGSLWSSDDHPSENQPRLQELSLQLPSEKFRAPSATALRTTLCDLTALRVITGVSRGCFEMHRTAVRRLLETHPALQYFHWEGYRKTSGPAKDTYAYRRAGTRRLLGKATTSVMECSRPLSVASRVAMLSVVYNTRDTKPTSPLACVDRDLLEQIFGFASTSGPRDLWIHTPPRFRRPI